MISVLRMPTCCGLLTLMLGLSACALGPLPSSTGQQGIVTGSVGAQQSTLADIHSSTCPGIAAEQLEHQRRIDALQVSINAELSNVPATIEQAVQRASGTPEAGTSAYRELMGEKYQMDQLAAAAAKMACPTLTAAKSP